MNSTIHNNFTISAEYTGSKPAPADGSNYNHSFLTIRNNENNQEAVFDAWASPDHVWISTNEDLMTAFFGIVMEANLGMNNFGDYCSAIGFDEDDPKSKESWKICRMVYSKFVNVSGYDDNELSVFLEELEEMM